MVNNINAQEQTEVKDTKFDRELNLTVGTLYPVDKSFTFENAYDINLFVGAQAFINKYVGIEANVPVYGEGIQLLLMAERE